MLAMTTGVDTFGLLEKKPSDRLESLKRPNLLQRPVKESTAKLVRTTDGYFPLRSSTIGVVETKRPTLQKEFTKDFPLSYLNTSRPDIQIIKTIRDVASLSSAWEGAEVSNKVVNDAEQFARILPLECINAPHVSPTEDGDISFFWRNDLVTVDVNFDGNGSYSFFAKLKRGKPVSGDNVPLKTPLPQEIISLLK